jgi:eukaryotic-like serine/threonine-protein kinase
MTTLDLSNYIIDHYNVVQPLQKRPLTTLYHGQDTQLVRPVFIEVLNTTVAADAELAGRYQRRLEIVRQLDHPHIAPILQVGRTSPIPIDEEAAPIKEQYVYAIIQYVPGSTLAETLKRWRQNNYRPDVIEALSLVQNLASALTAAHPVGIFHHDLRPANIIYDINGRLTFIDLGTPITPLPPVEPPDPNDPPRRLDYASPEQLEGKPLSSASNIYSLGILLYELLAGHRPQLPLSSWNIFERSELPREIPLTEIRTDLTKATHTVVKNCLWRQDWNRYETATHLVNALDAARNAEKRARSQPAGPDKLLRTYWQYVGLGLLFILLLIGSIWLFF